MYKYDIHESNTAAVITDDDGFVVAYLSAVENTTASRNLERMAKLLAKAEELEQACMLALQALQDPDFDQYFDANTLETTLKNAILGVSHA
jgi:hypothetical protein